MISEMNSRFRRLCLSITKRNFKHRFGLAGGIGGVAMAAFRLKADVVAVVAEIKGKGLLFQGGNFFNNFGENKVRITDAVVVIVELAGECVLIVFAEEVELFGKAVTVRRVAAAEMNKDDFL